MTRRPPERLYRAVLVDIDGKTVIFYLRAPSASVAADEAERQTGSDCVLVDDCQPRKKLAA